MVAEVIYTLMVLQAQPIKMVRHPLLVCPNEIEVLQGVIIRQTCGPALMTYHITVRFHPVRAILKNAMDGVMQACAKVICFGACGAGRALHDSADFVSNVSGAKSSEKWLSGIP
jgi:hypothetical protein